MEDVVKSGTGTHCKVDGMSVAGKTGTSSKDNDLWFAGYTPYLTATIWAGYDENAPLTNGVFHEDMWSKIVTRIDDVKGYKEDIGFPAPESVQSATICKSSGQLAIEGVCPSTTEYFSKGSIPKDQCNIHSRQIPSTAAASENGGTNNVNPATGNANSNASSTGN